MGGTRWSDDLYEAKKVERRASGKATFEYHDSMRATPRSAWVAHDSLSPKGLKFRESRDSDTHPTSKAVSVFFDVTGSMHSIPVELQKKLKDLMGLLLRKSYLDHPQVLFGAVGDAVVGDPAPLQVGQFESGVEMDNDLTKILLTGGGGGGSQESYDLAIYFLARLCKLDCFEKRSERGYAFIIGDEKAYDVFPKIIAQVFGAVLQDTISISAIVKEAQKMWDLYYILPTMASHGSDSNIIDFWKDLLGQNFFTLDDADGICELIASTIGVCEGVVDVDGASAVLDDTKASVSVKRAVSKALIPMSGKGGAIAKGISGTLATSAKTGGAKRI